MTGSMPESLTTSRLLLRRPQPSDAAIIFASYAQDPEVARYMIWQPHTALAETEAFITGVIDAWRDGDRRAWVLELRAAPGTPIGMLEGRRINSHMVDVGYVLARMHWGQGLMPEALLALTDTALASPDIYRVQATCDVGNSRSMRTLEKAGFVREGRLERYMVHPGIGSEPRAVWLYARCR